MRLNWESYNNSTVTITPYLLIVPPNVAWTNTMRDLRNHLNVPWSSKISLISSYSGSAMESLWSGLLWWYKLKTIYEFLWKPLWPWPIKVGLKIVQVGCCTWPNSNIEVWLRCHCCTYSIILGQWKWHERTLLGRAGGLISCGLIICWHLTWNSFNFNSLQ